MSVFGKIRALMERTAARQSALPDPARAKRLDPRPPPRPVPDTGYSQALAGIADPEFCRGIKHEGQQWRASVDGVHPDIVMFAQALVKRMRALNVPLFPHSYMRSSDEQDELYDLGVTKARGGQSAHNYGMAVDIIHGVKAWDMTPRQWAIIGHIGFEVARSKGLKLTWGGDDPGVDDKFNWDPAHWELADWRKLVA